MNGEDFHQTERQSILTRLLDAVKQCQVRFGGRSELATDSDSRISCLCSSWEASLQHGIRKNNKTFSAIKQMTERAGLSKVTDLFSDNKRAEAEIVYWQYVKEFLTKHEVERFNKLKLVTTDAGKGRAWLRASMNEHSLERYMHMLIENGTLLGQYYEDWAFIRDLERSSMLPNMAAGLGSILFAITVDRPELNKAMMTTAGSIHIQNSVDSIDGVDNEPRPVISEQISPAAGKKKEKKKKKKVANVVSFDDENNVGTVLVQSDSSGHPTNTTTSPLANTHTNGFSSLHSHQERREAAEGTLESTIAADQEVFSSTYSSSSFNDELSTTTMMPKSTMSLPTESNLSHGPPRLPSAHSPSIPSTNSSSFDRMSKSSCGSISDLDPDAGSFMVPIDPDGAIVDSEMVPYSSNSKSPSSFTSHHSASFTQSGEIESASLAITLAQQSLSNSRTQGDGGDSKDWHNNNMSQGQSMGGVPNFSSEPEGWQPWYTIWEETNEHCSEELKQAVVAMMLRKDSIEAKSKNIEGMLQHEMETTSLLRAEVEELKLKHKIAHGKDQDKIQALQKENELLKHQLKKYVNAVQMLRTEGINKEENLGIRLEEPQPSIPPPKPMIDYCHEASEYEKKLIQVAEMHGELMEFNEQLHRVVLSKESSIRQLREELVLLRGPLPFNSMSSPDSSQDNDLSLQRPLINIWIPSAFLRGSTNNTHHVYQVYVRIRDEEWNVYRRYSQFHDVHVRLKKVYPIVGKYEFPPKKAIGKKDAKLVEVRRHLFQTYLRNVINLMLEKDQVLASNASKEKLISYLPFFNDKSEDGGKAGKGKLGKRNSASNSTQPPPTLPEGATVGDDPSGGAERRVSAQYQGL